MDERISKDPEKNNGLSLSANY